VVQIITLTLYLLIFEGPAWPEQHTYS